MIVGSILSDLPHDWFGIRGSPQSCIHKQSKQGWNQGGDADAQPCMHGYEWILCQVTTRMSEQLLNSVNSSLSKHGLFYILHLSHIFSVSFNSLVVRFRSESTFKT